MTSPIRHAASLSLMVLFALGTAASAQPTSTDDAAARTHFAQGQRLSESGDYAGAYRAFEAGYQASPKPAFLFNMGEAARGMGDLVAARAAYHRFLAVESTGALADTARSRLVEIGPAAQTLPPATKPPVANSPVAKPPVRVPPPREVAAKLDASPNPGFGATTQPASESRPPWKKWPFWAVVGGVVATGVVVGVVATRGESVRCGTACVDFR